MKMSLLNTEEETTETGIAVNAGDQTTHKTHVGIVTLSTTVHKLIDELIQDLHNWTRHVSQALWESKQFAQKYACDHQDQTAHWSLNQATVHTIVTYYPCDKCSQITTESLVFSYDYLKHDNHAVHKFIETSIDHLRKNENLP